MYHYLVGLRVNDRKSIEEGELIYHVDFVFPYTEEDVIKVKLTASAMENEMWETSGEEAAQAFGSARMLNQFHFMTHRARFNNITVCHFYSNFELDPEWFSIFFRTNDKEYLKKKINEARVNL